MENAKLHLFNSEVLEFLQLNFINRMFSRSESDGNKSLVISFTVEDYECAEDYAAYYLLRSKLLAQSDLLEFLDEDRVSGIAAKVALAEFEVRHDL